MEKHQRQFGKDCLELGGLDKQKNVACESHA